VAAAAAAAGALVFAVVLVSSSVAGAQMLAVRSQDGALFYVSPDDASLTPTIPTAIEHVFALEMGPDGQVYGYDHNLTLFRFNPVSFELTLLGKIQTFEYLYEGAMAFAPDGRAYVIGSDFTTSLLRLDTTTLATTRIGALGDRQYDVNGMVWRSDGMLVGMDRVSNALITIDPATGAATQLAPLAPLVGTVGGLTILDGVGYLATGSALASTPGSNELWRFDLFTGAHVRVGAFDPAATGATSGIGGLAAIPEPAVVGGAVAALIGALGRERRARRFRSSARDAG
jgi:hypothetical protein